MLFLNNASGGAIYVEGFKIRKGLKTDNGGSIYAASYSYGMAGNITITDNILLLNAASSGSANFDWTSNEHVYWLITPEDRIGKRSEETWAETETQVEYINVLKWSANPNNQDLDISKYRIHLIDGEGQIQLVELNSNTLEYWHRGVTKAGIYRYALYAVDGSNKEGDPASITIQ